jgi:hypothetical protein
LEGGESKLVENNVAWLYLEKARLSGSTRRKPKARDRQGGTGGIQQPGRALTHKPKQPHIFYVSVRIQVN